MIFAFAATVVIVVGVIAFAAFEWHRIAPRRLMARMVSWTPFRIQMPSPHTAPEGVAEMGLAGEFFAILSSIRAPYALEVAVEHIGVNSSFYLVVPNTARDFAIQQVKKFWPQATVTPAGDHLIFNPTGSVVAGYLKEKKPPEFSMRTFQDAKANTCELLLQAFTGIHTIGEGLALQIIVRPATREETAALLPGKTGKQIFSATVRAIASAPTPLRAQELIDMLGGSLGQFDAENGQGLRFAATRNVDAAIRGFLDRTFDEKTAILFTSDELVSLIHIPTCAMEV